MKDFNLLNSLQSYTPYNQEEKENVKKVVEFLTNNDNCYDRSNLKGHITAGALIVSKDNQVLLNHHKIHNKWLHFGGHSDGEENSSNVALREAVEESGITEFQFIKEGIFDVDVHRIADRPSKNEPEHTHYDINFLLQAHNKNFHISDESTDIQWLPLQQAYTYVKNDKVLVRMLDKYQQLINTNN